ncbi:hypothetical protein LOD99_3390 [Oopsacas minuta]|uniref:ZZ-type domain-containing protein n=1 Tax=Oopsacas minuta TaxID=111878 RepID=A0AAV7JYD8_9METZ|nr:hypothetical protein LOD99_3390 [Oopsacas minuta]
MPEIEIASSPAVIFSNLEVTENEEYQSADPIPPSIRIPQLEWTRSMTSNYIPYYVTISPSEGLPRSSWLHPVLSEFLDSFPLLEEHNRYAAYRTAYKLRSLQTLTRLSRLHLASFYQSLSQHKLLLPSAPYFLSPLQLEDLLATAFSKSNFSGLEGSRAQLIATATELSLNFLLSCYDPGRTGAISLSSVKAAVTLLSVAPLNDKYKYLFQLTADTRKPSIDKQSFKQLLTDLLRLTVFLEESLAFGDKAINASYHSLLDTTGKQDSVNFQLSLREFLDWSVLEPQSLVWIPTLHRVAAIENTKHSVKCGICRSYPIKGFNFRCQKCTNLNICQHCFFSQRTNNMHKITHPIREYTLPTTSKEDIKDMLRVLRNKLSVSHYRKSKNKQSYLLHEKDMEVEPVISSTDEDDIHDDIRILAARLRDIESSPVAVLSGDVNDENTKLRTRLDYLEDKNRELQSLLDANQPTSSDMVSRYSIADNTRQYNRMSRSLQQERMEIRVNVLENHNKSLEEQLFSLRRSLGVGEREESQPADNVITTDKTNKFSEEDSLFALVSRMLSDSVTSKQRRLNPAVSDAVTGLGESLASMVADIQEYSSK